MILLIRSRTIQLQMKESNMSVLVSGDSHIRRLEHFVTRRHTSNPFNLQGRMFPGRFHGIPGG